MKAATNTANRERILNGIRHALRRGALAGQERETAEQRLAHPPLGPAVARASLAQPEKIALFCQWAEANNATVARVSAADMPSEVAAYLARNNLPAQAAIARRAPPIADRARTRIAARSRRRVPRRATPEPEPIDDDLEASFA